MNLSMTPWSQSQRPLGGFVDLRATPHMTIGVWFEDESQVTDPVEEIRVEWAVASPWETATSVVVGSINLTLGMGKSEPAVSLVNRQVREEVLKGLGRAVGNHPFTNPDPLTPECGLIDLRDTP